METNAQYVIDAMTQTIAQLQLEKAVLSAQVRQLIEAKKDEATGDGVTTD